MLGTPKIKFSFLLVLLACAAVAQVVNSGATALAPTATVQGLVGYWNFDDGSGSTARDNSGNANYGTVVNARWASGKFGSALDFTSGEGYVSLPSIPLVSASLEFWIYPHANAGNDSIILNYGNSGIDFRILGDGSLSGTAGGVGLNAPGYNFYAPGNSDRWYHVAYAFDASTQTHALYRDGVLVASGVNSQTIASGGRLWIGRNSQFDFGTFQGLLDEAKIYDRALSASEVFVDYQATPAVAPAAPAISSFTANPASINAGQTATLFWSSSNATSLSITPSPGVVASATGSVSVSPTAITTYTLTASNASGSVSSSVTVSVMPISPTPVPSTKTTLLPPTNVAASALTSSHVNVSWVPSTSARIKGYKVMRDGTHVGSAKLTSYLDTGLAPSTKYTYTIVAFDVTGTTSQPSAPASATTPSALSQPVISAFSASPAAITAGQSTSLSWSTTGATALSISPGPGAVSPDNGSVSISPTATTTYTLSATNSGGSVSSSVTVTVNSTADSTPPSVPTNVTAIASSSSQVTVSWAASTDNTGVTGYKITRNGAQVGTAPSTSYSDGGLSAGVTYSYTVAAFDAAGNTSAASASVSVTTPAAATKPVISSFTANPAAITAGQSASLLWSSSGATTLSISPAPGTVTASSGSVSVSPTSTTTYTLTATNSAGSTTSSLTLTVTPAGDTIPPSVPSGVAVSMSSFDHFTISWTGSTDNVGVAGYRIMRNGALLGTTTATTYLDGGLAAATTYTYTIVAFDAAGNASAASVPVSISTQGTQSQPSISSFGASPTTIGAGQSTSLSWLTGGATTLTITPAPGTVIPSNGSVSVSPAATTTYTLTASNTAGSVSASVTVTVGSTTPDTTPPSPPSNTTAVATSSSQVIVSWVASPEADVAGYKVTRNGAPLSSTASTSYLDSGLAGSTVYTYTVTAFDTAGNTSAASVPASVTTPAGTPSGPPPSAPGNGIVITDLSGAGQANRPFTVSRVFVQGEFPAGSYPQARLGGPGGSTVLTQADVKNTWSDGSVRHVMISFAASVPASGNLTVDFVSQSTPNNSGYLDKNGILNYNGGGWGADIEVTNGSTLIADARAILTAWNGADTGPNGLGVRYWLKGPVVTQVIVEDRSANLQFDMGWDSVKPLHPIFVLTFYPGSGLGVKVESIVENMWTTKLKDQSYSVALKTGNPLSATVYSKPTFTHIAQSRWRKVFWSGAAPRGWSDEGHPGVNVNYNLAYIAASKAVPNFDLTKVVPASTIAGDVNAFNSSDRGDINGVGLWLQAMPTTGGRPDIGLIPAWYVRYLYTMNNPSMYALLLGMGEVSGYVPFHFRESATGRMFDSARTVSAFGRPISIDARPTVYIPNLSYSGQNPADMITPVGPVSTNGWAVDLAHQPAFAYIPYLITGDWYFLEELYFLGARDLGVNVGGSQIYGRHDSWGWFSDQDVQTRAQAWGRRDIAEAGFMAPDGSPEKAYFTEKVNNNLAIEEGFFNTTTGSFYQACTSNPYSEALEQSKWCWGRKTAARNWSNPLHFGVLGHTDNVFVRDAAIAPQSDPNAPSWADQPWMTLYKLNVSGHTQELGYQAAGANLPAFQHLINILANPAFNPYLCGAYMGGRVMKSSGTFYQTWGSLLLSFNPAFAGSINLRTVNRWWDTTSDDNSPDGFPHICQGAASYLPGLSEGGITGQAAWDWTVTHINSAPLNDNPQYAIVPR